MHRTRDEIQIERNRMNQLFKNMNEQKREFDTAYSLGALHVLEWLLNNEQKPISELILFKYKMEKG